MTEGERWARDELLALRSARFHPRAGARLLAASWRRAASTRAERPALTRQARAWSATALLTGLGAIGLARSRTAAVPSARAWTCWSLASAVMLDWHLGMLEGPRGEPHERLRAADALTLARLGLVPFLAAARAPAPLLIASATSDLLDGKLARRAGPTRLGGDLDAIADALGGAAAVRAARRSGWLSPTSSRLAAARHLAPMGLVAGSYFATGRRPDRDAFGQMRWSAPLMLAGLVLGPSAPRAGNALVRGASLLAIAIAVLPLRTAQRPASGPSR